jgi:hypothetical protein
VTRHSPQDKPKASSEDGEGHYVAYLEHARTLRTWLVAYGIGGPVLLLSQDSLWKRLAASGQLPCIATLFLLGVALQVLLAATNKNAMWAVYYGTIEPSYKQTLRYRFGEWLSSQYTIDFFVDLTAMVLFAVATYRSCVALLNQ